MRKKGMIIAGIIAFVGIIGFVLWGPIMSQVERPKYQLIATDGKIEIRQYPSMIIAEVKVDGERTEAINKGFRLLADFIFGNNTSQKEIAMTAPVQQQNSEKIAMTAPVQQESSSGGWKISFVMPSEYTMATLPKPNNQQVKLKEIPQQKFVVIKFSGFNSDENIMQHEEALLNYMTKHSMNTISAPKYAFYNPPWTLPFLKRNEIMLQIK